MTHESTAIRKTEPGVEIVYQSARHVNIGIRFKDGIDKYELRMFTMAKFARALNDEQVYGYKFSENGCVVFYIQKFEQ